MITPDQIQLAKDIGYGVALGGFQLYNVWKHKQNVQRIAVTDARISVTHDDVTAIRADVQAAREAIERIDVRIVGGDRRAIAPALPNSGATANLERRWRDYPNQGQPFEEGP